MHYCCLLTKSASSEMSANNIGVITPYRKQVWSCFSKSLVLWCHCNSASLTLHKVLWSTEIKFLMKKNSFFQKGLYCYLGWESSSFVVLFVSFDYRTLRFPGPQVLRPSACYYVIVYAKTAKDIILLYSKNFHYG